jgi:hypothetical protein
MEVNGRHAQVPFTFEETAPGTHCVWGWDGPGTGTGAVQKFLPLPETEPSSCRSTFCPLFTRMYDIVQTEEMIDC